MLRRDPETIKNILQLAVNAKEQHLEIFSLKADLAQCDEIKKYQAKIQNILAADTHRFSQNLIFDKEGIIYFDVTSQYSWFVIQNTMREFKEAQKSIDDANAKKISLAAKITAAEQTHLQLRTLFVNDYCEKFCRTPEMAMAAYDNAIKQNNFVATLISQFRTHIELTASEAFSLRLSLAKDAFSKKLKAAFTSRNVLSALMVGSFALALLVVILGIPIAASPILISILCAWYLALSFGCAGLLRAHNKTASKNDLQAPVSQENASSQLVLDLTKRHNPASIKAVIALAVQARRFQNEMLVLIAEKDKNSEFIDFAKNELEQKNQDLNQLAVNKTVANTNLTQAIEAAEKKYQELLIQFVKEYRLQFGSGYDPDGVDALAKQVYETASKQKNFKQALINEMGKKIHIPFFVALAAKFSQGSEPFWTKNVNNSKLALYFVGLGLISPLFAMLFFPPLSTIFGAVLLAVAATMVIGIAVKAGINHYSSWKQKQVIEALIASYPLQKIGSTAKMGLVDINNQKADLQRVDGMGATPQATTSSVLATATATATASTTSTSSSSNTLRKKSR